MRNEVESKRDAREVRKEEEQERGHAISCSQLKFAARENSRSAGRDDVLVAADAKLRRPSAEPFVRVCM